MHSPKSRAKPRERQRAAGTDAMSDKLPEATEALATEAMLVVNAVRAAVAPGATVARISVKHLAPAIATARAALEAYAPPGAGAPGKFAGLSIAELQVIRDWLPVEENELFDPSGVAAALRDEVIAALAKRNADPWASHEGSGREGDVERAHVAALRAALEDAFPRLLGDRNQAHAALTASPAAGLAAIREVQRVGAKMRGLNGELATALDAIAAQFGEARKGDEDQAR
jgi:hypothetical protein